jgi:hypothetical protein
MNAQPHARTMVKLWFNVLGGVLMFLVNQRRVVWTRTPS